MTILPNGAVSSDPSLLGNEVSEQSLDILPRSIDELASSKKKTNALYALRTIFFKVGSFHVCEFRYPTAKSVLYDIMRKGSKILVLLLFVTIYQISVSTDTVPEFQFPCYVDVCTFPRQYCNSDRNERRCSPCTRSLCRETELPRACLYFCQNADRKYIFLFQDGHRFSHVEIVKQTVYYKKIYYLSHIRYRISLYLKFVSVYQKYIKHTCIRYTMYDEY